MYSYHNRIKQRIKANELERYEFIDNHKGNSIYGLMLHFTTEPYTRPIKRERIEMYKEILGL